MKTRRTLRWLGPVVFAGLLATACGAPAHPYSARADGARFIPLATYQRDLYECTRDTAMVPRVAYPTAPAPLPGADFGTSVVNGVRQGQYDEGVAAAQAAEHRAAQLFKLCMTSRGYVRH